MQSQFSESSVAVNNGTLGNFKIGSDQLVLALNQHVSTKGPCLTSWRLPCQPYTGTVSVAPVKHVLSHATQVVSQVSMCPVYCV